MSARTGVGVLLRADLVRLAAQLRRPSAAALLGVLLPAALIAAGIWGSGRLGAARLEVPRDGVLLGCLVGGPVAFLAYGTLFRGADDGFLRRIGVPAGALYAERSLRLLAWAAVVTALALLAFAGEDASAGAVLGVAAPAALAGWGSALLSTAGAAHMMTRPARSGGWGVLSMGMWDRELAQAAPLVYAPLIPLMVSGIGGGALVAARAGWVVCVALALVALLGVVIGRRAYVAALPRFAPMALEMTWAPAAAIEGGGFPLRRGIARVLPRRVAAVRARDSLVAGRRFAWASRVMWPVAIISFLALARWGTEPVTRGWVATAVVLVLVVQGAAMVALGQVENRGPRWIDRAAGARPAIRFLGRWGWGWGLSLGLLLPVALAWGWWTQAGPGWPWLFVGGASTALASAASLAAGGR